MRIIVILPKDEKLKSELLERLQTVENPVILHEVWKILDRVESKRDFWEELTAKQQALVRKGMAELSDGKGIPAEEVLRGLKR